MCRENGKTANRENGKTANRESLKTGKRQTGPGGRLGPSLGSRGTGGGVESRSSRIWENRRMTAEKVNAGNTETVNTGFPVLEPPLNVKKVHVLRAAGGPYCGNPVRVFGKFEEVDCGLKESQATKSPTSAGLFVERVSASRLARCCREPRRPRSGGNRDYHDADRRIPLAKYRLAGRPGRPVLL